MPYGLPKEMGGDSPENDKWMENCIQKVQKKGKDKNSAILICKKSFMMSHGDQGKAEFIISQILFNINKEG